MSKKKISKEVREEAALICAIAASMWYGEPEFRTGITGAAHAFDMSGHAEALAWDAYMNALGVDANAYAEAEAMLRCGWSPV